METAKLKAVVAVLKSMSMKAGTYIRDASVKTADAVNEGTKSLRESKFGASAGETVSSIGTRAAEGSTYVYNVTKTTAQGVVGRLAAAGIPAECAREARYVMRKLVHMTSTGPFTMHNKSIRICIEIGSLGVQGGTLSANGGNVLHGSLRKRTRD